MKIIMHLWTLVFVLANYSYHSVQAKKILCLSMQQVSHMRELHAIGEQLISNGHEVYTAVQSNFPGKKIEEFKIQGLKILEFSVPENEPCFASSPISFEQLVNPEVVLFYANIAFQHCQKMMNDITFVNKVRDLKFDLTLVDGFFPAPCMFILPYHLNIPYIFECAVIPPYLLRIPGLPSFQPSVYKRFDHSMSFLERLKNTYIFFSFALMGFPTANQYDLLEKYAPRKTWEDLMKKSVLFIGTRDQVMENPMVLMPNVIMVPGLTIRDGRPLTPEYEAIMEDSKHGVIVMTFGAATGELPHDIMVKILDALGKLEQTVFFRYASTLDAHQVPGNVIVKDWLPQQDLLAHEKTRLFITHCGNNGRHEAAYHAVPMLAIPLFADQHHNAFMLGKKGIALEINIHSFTAEEMITKIKRLLTDETFSQNIQRLSRILRDRPMSPRDTAVYWVEHVMKYGGEHLRSHAMDMPGYAYYMLDVLAVLLVALLFIILILCAIVKIIKWICFRKVKQE